MKHKAIRIGSHMEDNYLEKAIAIVCGMVGGFIAFFTADLSLMDIAFDATYWYSLSKAAVTAIVCGFAGLAGKWVFNYMVKWYKGKKKKKTKQ